MSKTLLRGLELIEVVGAHGSMTVTEIAREMGLEPSIVSRTVAACETDGWLIRVNGKVAVGPRSALLGLTSPTTDAIHRADPLIRALAGVLGVTATAGALIGRQERIRFGRQERVQLIRVQLRGDRPPLGQQVNRHPRGDPERDERRDPGVGHR